MGRDIERTGILFGIRFSLNHTFVHAVLALIFLNSSDSQPYHRPPNNNNNNSSYVDECRMDCEASRDLFTCGKYRAVRWCNDLIGEQFTYGPFRLIRLPPSSDDDVSSEAPETREGRGTKKLTKFLNFVRTSAADLMTRRALVYTFDQSSGGSSGRLFSSVPTLVDEDELDRMQNGKLENDERILLKKKKSIILPIIVLVKLFKLKLMLLPIFFGVHFIKKFLVLGALIVPSILAHLKYCKIPPTSHHHQQPAYSSYHGWSTAAEAPVDYPTGFGHEDAGWDHRSDVQGVHGYASPYAPVGYHGPYVGYYRGHRQAQPSYGQ